MFDVCLILSSTVYRELYHLTQDTHSPSSFSAILFLPILSKASARCPARAPLPTCSFHMIRSWLALSRLWLYSSSRFRIFDAAILSFGPNSRQQVPTSSLMSDSCNSVTTDFLGSIVSSIRERNKAVLFSNEDKSY